MRQIRFYFMLFVLLASGQAVGYGYELAEWAIMIKRKSVDVPEVLEYFTLEREIEDGTLYRQIYLMPTHYCYLWDDGIPQPYGYRYQDKRIYIYNFDTKEERVAFDFNLTVGDQFTTYNGEQWVIEAETDTMVFEGYPDALPPVWCKMHTVKNLKTGVLDHWLENMGSVTNHLMIEDWEDAEMVCTLFMPGLDGESFVYRTFSADPIFGHNIGWLFDDYPHKAYGRQEYSCSYENGTLTLNMLMPLEVNYAYYFSFYRVGDEMFYGTNWRFGMDHNCGKKEVKMTVVFTGLPDPESGVYTVHIGTETITTDVSSPTTPQPQWPRYDLQGRPISQPQPRQMYIEGGKKVVNGR